MSTKLQAALTELRLLNELLDQDEEIRRLTGHVAELESSIKAMTEQEHA